VAWKNTNIFTQKNLVITSFSVICQLSLFSKFGILRLKSKRLLSYSYRLYSYLLIAWLMKEVIENWRETQHCRRDICMVCLVTCLCQVALDQISIMQSNNTAR